MRLRGQNRLEPPAGHLGDANALAGEDSYSFTWAGKQEAFRAIQTPSAASLAPAPEESVNWETTQHLFIEGENLEVLKLLYKSYYGRVKMIYIDPPYNTGNDFVYRDDYRQPRRAYLEKTGQIDAEGNVLTSNPETSGRYHSDWLSMMYPRLFLARQLLRDDGVIFVSIDDNEVHNLRLVMNEVFGEENHFATIVWQKKDTPSNDVAGFSVNHEYVMAYVRSPSFIRKLLPRTNEQLAIYKNPDNDPRGLWTRTALTRKEFVERDYYPISNPQGREVYPPPGTSWRVSRKTLQRLFAENRLWWGINNDGDMPFVKRFLSEVQQGVVPTTWWHYKFAGSNRNAKMEIRSLFDREAPFETPKPSRLVSQLTTISTSDDDIILDFFAGSCTTAQAVLDQNRSDGGRRRVILVQLPEPTSENSPARSSGYSTIADIGKERIRRVIARMQEAQKGQLPLETRETPEDLGFKVFKLAPSTFRQWKPPQGADPDTLAQQLAMFDSGLREGADAWHVIYEVLLKEGYSLNARIEPLAIETNRVYRVTDAGRNAISTHFYICLDDEVRDATLDRLALDKETAFVCLDTALDDSQKVNLAMQCVLKVI